MDCPNHKANDYEGKNGATSDSFPSAKLWQPFTYHINHSRSMKTVSSLCTSSF